MDEIVIYNSEEIITALRIVVKFLFLIFANSIGTFTRGVIYKNENTMQQSWAFAILAAIIALWILTIYEDKSSFVFGLLISIPIGFFIPAFKNMLKGIKIIKVLLKAFSNASTMSDNVISELEKEMESNDA